MPAISRRTYSWNAYESVLSSGIDGTTTTITLDSVVGLREPNGYMVLNPDDAASREFIKYASIVGNTLQGCTRGLAGGNTNQSHDSGATMRAVPMHQHFDDLWDTAEELILEDANHVAAADPHAAAGYITETAGDARYLQLTGGGMLGPIDMQAAKIVDLGDPSADGDAANKLYVDTKVSGTVADYLPLIGGSMSGDINMSGGKVTNLINPPVDPGEATRKDYVDAQAAGAVTDHEAELDPHPSAYVPVTGGTFTGALQLVGGFVSENNSFAPKWFASTAGGIGAPAFTWADEPSSGMYLPQTGDLRFTVLGVLRLRVQDTLVSITSERLLIPNGGTEAAPGIYFNGDNDTGFFHSANNISIATGGTERLKIVNAIDHLINDGPLRAIHSGTGAPAGALGVNGDIYCDVS